LEYGDDYGYWTEEDFGGSGRVLFQHISSVDALYSGLCRFTSLFYYITVVILFS
jgi:hypothetical protein